MTTTMTKKHYIMIAGTIRDLPLSPQDKEVVIRHFINMLKMTNPNFEPITFRKAAQKDTDGA